MNLLKKFPLIKHLLLMLGVFVLLVLLTFFILRIYTRHGKEYSLPNILNKNLSEINQMTEMERFEIILLDSVYVSNKEGGVVLAMDPPPEAKVKSGRKVYVTITSSVPENVEVPNLVDLTVRQAVSLLESYGLKCGVLTFQSDIARNAVLSQSHNGKKILPNTKIPRHSSIDLLVGSGTDSVFAPTTVPLIVGKTLQEARRALNVASLNVGQEHFGKGATESNARVKRQSPDYIGRPSARLGASVDIWYVKGETEDFDKILKEYSSRVADSLSVESVDEEEETDNW